MGNRKLVCRQSSLNLSSQPLGMDPEHTNCWPPCEANTSLWLLRDLGANTASQVMQEEHLSDAFDILWNL